MLDNFKRQGAGGVLTAPTLNGEQKLCSTRHFEYNAQFEMQ